jgi:hypothetical protein
MAKRKVSESDLAALLDEQLSQAKDYDGSELSARRTKALEYLDGEMRDVPALKGRSKVVSRDVADTLGYIEPGVGRVFFGTDELVRYEPKRRSAEAFAQQATDYVNHIVVNECDGYRQFKFGIHDGLLHGNGIIKHYWDPTKKHTTERFTGLSQQAYEKLVADEEVEVLEHSEYPEPSQPSDNGLAGQTGTGGAGPGGSGGSGALPGALPAAADGGPMGGPEAALPMEAVPGASPEASPGPLAAPQAGADPLAGILSALGVGDAPAAPVEPQLLHDLKVKRICSYGQVRVQALPNEQFLIDPEARVLDEENVSFCAHSWKCTRSSLIEEGFDPDVVEGLPSHSEIEESEDTARRPYFDVSRSADRSMELVERHECYIKLDMNGDGVAEWVKADMAGGTGKRHMLKFEEWGDDLPFSDIVPDPVPHRWQGRSIFDEMEDLQRIKTVLLRGMFDNLYWVNNPMLQVLVNQVENEDRLLNPDFGEVLYVKQLDTVKPLPVPFVADKIYPALELIDAIAEKRTGVSMRTTALDMDALQNQTATATNAMQAASHTKVEEYARNIAECGGFKRIFACILKLICKHQDKPRTIRLREEWVEVDPRGWDSDMDVTINTGLGTGSRDKDLAMLQGLAMKLEQINAQVGPQVATGLGVGPSTLFDVYRKMTEAAGIRQPEAYFPDIDDDQVAQAFKSGQQPNPQEEAEKAKTQFEMHKFQVETEQEERRFQVESQSKLAEIQMKDAIERGKSERDLMMQQAQMEREGAKEQMQAEADIATKQRELEMQAMMAEREFQHKAALDQQKFEFDKQLKLLEMNIRERDSRRQFALNSMDAEDPAEAVEGVDENGDERPPKPDPHLEMLHQLMAVAGRKKTARKLGDGSWEVG